MYTLSAEQVKIKDFIINNKRCCVFAGCGVGKTLATLSALLETKERPILIVAPLRVAKFGWQEQALQFAIPFTFSKIMGTEAERIAAYNTPADVYLINYENLKWLDESLPFKFKTVVCDEATKIKNHLVYMRKDHLVRRRGRNSTALVSHCADVDRWINLTATPVHNHLKDLWGIQFPIDFGKALGPSRAAFLEKYFNSHRFKSHLPSSYTPKTGARHYILKKIAKTSISCFYAYDDLIEITDVKINMPDKVRKEYISLQKNKGLITPSGDCIIDHVGMKQRQFTSGFVLKEDGAAVNLNNFKQQALLDLLQKLEGNIVIVYQFKHEAKLLEDLLPGAKNITTDTVNTLEEWNSGKLKYLLIHPKSAGHGVNLQHGGNKMVFYSADWDSELYAQTVERIGVSRQKLSGYNRKVYIYRLVVEGTIENKILNKIRLKLKNAI